MVYIHQNPHSKTHLFTMQKHSMIGGKFYPTLLDSTIARTVVTLCVIKLFHFLIFTSSAKCATDGIDGIIILKWLLRLGVDWIHVVQGRGQVTCRSEVILVSAISKDNIPPVTMGYTCTVSDLVQIKDYHAFVNNRSTNQATKLSHPLNFCQTSTHQNASTNVTANTEGCV
jgi:hypothetical protein